MMENEEIERLRRIVADLAALPRPEARRVYGREGAPRSVAVLPGAFDPPTLAHLALARAAGDRGFDTVLLSISTRTIDKEAAGGLDAAERLYLLGAITAADDRRGVLVQNRGLYAEQAGAVRAALPSAADVAFVVGMDKVSQIFDTRYYENAAAALAALFTQARLLVAARGDLDRGALRTLLERGPARGYAERVSWLELDPRWRTVSATRVRERLARGELPREWLPLQVANYLGAHAARFTAPGR
ncbi:MAG: hypothetical protein HYY35_03335 [Deltaproteobacteria bacterium]|nr:hypothetical protein [Deltaproteobacteria bacterium]